MDRRRSSSVGCQEVAERIASQRRESLGDIGQGSGETRSPPARGWRSSQAPFLYRAMAFPDR
ncbi:MAG: hypothetical protein ACK53L_07290, partial [Pirellulaceae bacterium]